MIEISRLAIDHNGDRLLDLSLKISSATGLVGKSGSGKSLTIKALLSMLPQKMRRELAIDAPFEFRRGETIGYIPQNPFTALSPMSRLEDQFHAPRQVAIDRLESVGLGEWTLGRFPAELSGGQLQRAIIAIALAAKPRLLLLDEPTTALDSTSKRSVLEILAQIKREGVYLLFVSHDIAAVAEVCDTIAVLENGRVVERGASDQILTAPKSREARALVASNFAKREFRQ